MLKRQIVLYSFILSFAGTLAAAEQQLAKPAAGDRPPSYVGRGLGGEDLNLDLGSGKAYVITFWASWCAPCLQELPVLTNIQTIAGTDKVQVIAINIEERDVYRKFESKIKELGLTSTFDPSKKAREAYGVLGIPHMIIVGRDGVITAVRVGYAKSSLEELAASLNQALAAGPATALPKEVSPPTTR